MPPALDLRLIEAMLTAGSYGEGHLFPTERGTPQGGVAPLLSNILLTPFGREMRRKGYQLTKIRGRLGGDLRVRGGGAGGVRGGKSCLEGAGRDH